MKLNLYLNFNGQTEAAFLFYRSVFGGEFASLQRFRDMPDASMIPAQDLDKVLHVSYAVGDMVLMGSDTLESLGQPLVMGNNCNLSVHPETRAEADRLFHALSEGGKVEMPMQNMFWGGYFGAFTDRFGVPWMINCEVQ
jgi:PhnB protein